MHQRTLVPTIGGLLLFGKDFRTSRIPGSRWELCGNESDSADGLSRHSQIPAEPSRSDHIQTPRPSGAPKSSAPSFPTELFYALVVDSRASSNGICYRSSHSQYAIDISRYLTSVPDLSVMLGVLLFVNPSSYKERQYRATSLFLNLDHSNGSGPARCERSRHNWRKSPLVLSNGLPGRHPVCGAPPNHRRSIALPAHFPRFHSKVLYSLHRTLCQTVC